MGLMQNVLLHAEKKWIFLQMKLEMKKYRTSKMVKNPHQGSSIVVGDDDYEFPAKL